MRESHTISPHGNGSVSTGNVRAMVPMMVTPLTITQGDDGSEVDSIMQEIQNDDGALLDQDDLVDKITQRLEVFKIYPKADFNDARYPVTNQVRRARVFSDRGEKKERSTSQI